jgi:subtilase family serine protease
LKHRPVGIAVVGVVLLAASGVISSPASAASSAQSGFTAIAGSVPATTDVSTGAYTSNAMTVEVALAPSNNAQLQSLLASVYDTSGSSYEHWLSKGQFNARFAPSAGEVSAVDQYLRASGLVTGRSSSPFLVTATGSSNRVSSAFRTTLRTFRDSKGVAYFANSGAVELPSSIASGVLGVIGLTNTVRHTSQVQRAPSVASSKPKNVPTCETAYPSEATLFAYFNSGTPFDDGYGAGPGCSGLTPSQENSIYGAPAVGQRGKGLGVTLAVFELSAYQQSDVATYVHQFYGASHAVPLVDENVDGGPLTPACPSGDVCPAEFNGYAGDIEVDADIETQLAVAPAAQSLIVYNAPNDFTGQTSLDEIDQIAQDDTADVISSSWAVCEQDATAAYVQSENVFFEQMALQGQSFFGAEGDTGAFSCIRSDGSTGLAVLDPPSQPWVTSVGGTSLETDNPGLNSKPVYPMHVESVWNVQNLCNTSADEGNFPGVFWCAETGAAGGGNSMYWGEPFYQHGPGVGVHNAYTAHGNGSTNCSLAAVGALCRTDPDISANADEFTPYAEYCTANSNTPNSQCGFSSSTLVPGWFGIGGTSLSSPFVSAVIADHDSYLGGRIGNANPYLYGLYDSNANHYFHDVNGTQPVNNNGFYPTTIGYDLATGLGTPRMAPLITQK